MSAELKRCPFCGQEIKLEEWKKQKRYRLAGTWGNFPVNTALYADLFFEHVEQEANHD